MDAHEKLNLAQQAVSDLVSDPTVDSVYLGGSLTAGLGNNRSDVDVFVVLSDKQPNGGERPSEQRYAEGQRFDLEFVDVAWLGSALRTFEGYQVLKTTFTTVMDRNLESLADRLVRLHHSLPVKTSPAYDAARDAVAERLPDIRRFLVTSYTAQFMSYHEDCVGAFESGHVSSGLVISQNMLMAACEAFLAGSGDLYRGAKWVPAKLARTALDWGAVVDRLVNFRDGDPLKAVADRLRLSQSLVGLAQTLGWDEPLAATALPPPLHDQLTGPVRNLTSLGWRAADGCVLARDYDTQLHVSTEGLLLWALSDGRPREHLLDAMCEARETLVRDEVNRYLDSLISRGVLVGEK